MNKIVRFSIQLAGVASLALASSFSIAQDWPSKPIRVIVPYPAGGGVDFVSRTVAQRLSEVLKSTVVVENRAGASGAIGAEAVARSAPDGYTILIASPAEVVVSPISGKKLSYSVERDLSPVILIGETPLVLAAHPSFPAKSVNEMLALVRSAPGKYSYGSPGTGSSMHYAGESLNAMGKIDLQHVPYKGAAPAVADLVGGQIPMGIVGMPPTVPFAKTGKLRILAVTSAKRSVAMPEVPTLAELPGFAGYRFTNWMGVYVAAKTPQAVVDKLSATIAQIVKEPAIRTKLLAQGVEPAGGSTADFVAFLNGERETYTKVGRERGIRSED
ncbi:tripartite tricarboxylate transporter substrate binding protein [Lacisediminimonas sp.]|uniref:Bug family tripartite tricarboxylate transporter substrate binding protein n=1 Tax=Lacisediminimonas sp. TaxID=3060582 RepID=UPI0027161C37|nr:tripartite tricarboxylate transporter substrate binding protein [Lacisediminimonas sp.]MDO8301527.1 tripartite tricarboxylate transporter substrate binding protein [Lacisediminimonas sp.]